MDLQLDEPDLRSYLGVVGRRKWWVIGLVAVALGAAVGLSFLAEPQYRVKATVQTRGITDPATWVLSDGRSLTVADASREAQNELAYLESSDLRFAVADSCNAPLPCGDVWRIQADTVQIGNVNNMTSSVVELTLVSADAEGAANLLNAYVTTYVEQLQANEQESMIDLLASLRTYTSELEQTITETREPLARLDQQIAEAAAAGDTATVEARQDERERLDRELQPTLSALYNQKAAFEEQIFQLQFTTGLANGGGARVLGRAGVPNAPVSPNLPLNIGIGLVGGLMLGIAAAFLRDYFDDSVKSKEVVERVTGVPALGLIPRFDTAGSELVASSSPNAPATEAFRSLRTSLKFIAVDRDMRVLQVTSPSQGEGKTVVAANLAAAFAQAGDRVVLVGADLRRPRVEELVGVPLTPGMTGVLIGEVTLPQAIRGVEGQPNLSVLPAGHPPPNPSELLSGERAQRLVEVLSQTYDLVIIDSPPVLPVSDSLVLASMADTTLLVTSANKTSRRALDRCVEMLDQVGAPLVGSVLSSLTPGAAYASEGYRYESVLPPRHKGKDQSQPSLVPAGAPSKSATGSVPSGPYASSGNGGDDQNRQPDFWPEGPLRD